MHQIRSSLHKPVWHRDRTGPLRQGMFACLTSSAEFFKLAVTITSNDVCTGALSADRMLRLAPLTRMPEPPASEALHRGRVIGPGSTANVAEIYKTGHNSAANGENNRSRSSSDIVMTSRQLTTHRVVFRLGCSITVIRVPSISFFICRISPTAIRHNTTEILNSLHSLTTFASWLILGHKSRHWAPVSPRELYHSRCHLATEVSLMRKRAPLVKRSSKHSSSSRMSSPTDIMLAITQAASCDIVL
ncbi:uncharacterized protein LOC134209415 [Armigeres subalbatus]|uniref:uncharacterized protein LOC134209415 n=1 Tax=Armigeres subalbatus TaxID=124917 RepID=UPI002ED1350B